jgi:CubicO group peptidase (beta-lactamase class C family)
MIFGIQISYADSTASIDQALTYIMQAYNVPVVGYAIIKHNKIVAVQTVSADPSIIVNTHSMFQAASITKSISAYTALILVQNRKLNLDTPVNDELKSWYITNNQYTLNHPVTLRQILSMTSGLSVGGYPGHSQGEALPTLNQILNGEPPANTPATQVFYQPGSRFFYSGGSYEVLEQLITDVSGQSFAAVATKNVLNPIGMDDSTFDFPLSGQLKSKAIPAFLADGSMIPGGWNNYAISAAGGLWSTPSDLAKFAINVNDAYLGKGGLVSQKLAKQMLKRQPNSPFGFGVVVNGSGKDLNFTKTGHNLGYYNTMTIFPNTGQGIVIMTDSENGIFAIAYIEPILVHQYRL